MNRAEAFELLKKYNKEEFHIKHGETVEGVMRYFAQELGYGDEVEFWGMVGLLHDIDFEEYPEQHCVKAVELLNDAGAEDRPYKCGGFSRLGTYGYRRGADTRNGKGALCNRRAYGTYRSCGADETVKIGSGYGA